MRSVRLGAPRIVARALPSSTTGPSVQSTSDGTRSESQAHAASNGQAVQAGVRASMSAGGDMHGRHGAGVLAAMQAAQQDAAVRSSASPPRSPTHAASMHAGDKLPAPIRVQQAAFEEALRRSTDADGIRQAAAKAVPGAYSR